MQQVLEIVASVQQKVWMLLYAYLKRASIGSNSRETGINRLLCICAG